MQGGLALGARRHGFLVNPDLALRGGAPRHDPQRVADLVGAAQGLGVGADQIGRAHV